MQLATRVRTAGWSWPFQTATSAWKYFLAKAATCELQPSVSVRRASFKDATIDSSTSLWPCPGAFARSLCSRLSLHELGTLRARRLCDRTTADTRAADSSSTYAPAGRWCSSMLESKSTTMLAVARTSHGAGQPNRCARVGGCVEPFTPRQQPQGWAGTKSARAWELAIQGTIHRENNASEKPNRSSALVQMGSTQLLPRRR